MAATAPRFALRVIAVVLQIGGVAAAAFFIANSADTGDGDEVTDPTAPITPSAPSPTASRTSSPVDLAEECRTIGQRLAEIEFAIRDTWKTHHQRARAQQKPRQKGEVYRQAAGYFRVLAVDLGTIEPAAG